MVKNTRKSLIDDIKILNSKHKTLREFAEEKYVNSDGFANIDVFMDGNEYFDPYSDPNAPELSEDFINYIEKQAYYIPVDYPLQVTLHSTEKIDADAIENKIKEHYWKELSDKEDDLKNNKIISTILFILGTVLLSAYFLIAYLPATSDIFNEILSIAGSFTIWEAIDYFILNRNAIKIQKLNTAQLALIKIKVV